MYTANTMSSIAEALGMSLPGSASPASFDRRRDLYAHRSGEAVVKMLEKGLRTPRHLDHGGVGKRDHRGDGAGWLHNAVFTCWPLPTKMDVELTLDDFNRIGDKTPHVGDLKPFGHYVMNDVDRHGGFRCS
jgi:dihydroxy-acid dehydratase